MSCQHGVWDSQQCDECDALDAAYNRGWEHSKETLLEKISTVETYQFLTDVLTASGLLYHGKTDKVLARRISDDADNLRKILHELSYKDKK